MSNELLSRAQKYIEGNGDGAKLVADLVREIGQLRAENNRVQQLSEQAAEETEKLRSSFGD